MKKMFFYANVSTFDLILGITRKVFAQIDAFRQAGYDVTYSGYLKDGVAIFNNEGEVIAKKKYPVGNPTIQHVLRRGMLMALCRKYFKDNHCKYDLTYARYHFFDKKYIRLLSTLKDVSEKVVVEAHSTPKFQKGLNIMTYVGWKDSRWNKYAKDYVDLVASMSGDDEMWGIIAIKISNGIDVNSIKLHDYNGKPEDLNFIAVSFEWEVHGYDRLLRGIADYYKQGGKRNIYFHIVGTTLSSTDALIRDLKLEDRCIKYGPQKGEELDAIYDKANIGVGCLANHRIGSTFGSALKTKEYIAKGIPFIYGWQEAVLENFKYGLQFELCEDPIDINKVVIFYDSLPKENLATTIRSHLGYEDTWGYQVKKVLDNLGQK